MMNYEIFKEVVKEKFMDYMPDSFKGMELIVRPAEKVNMTYDAINIRGEDTTISPTIYINDMYEKYQSCGDLEETLMAACDLMAMEFAKTPQVVDVDSLYKDADEKVVFQLINTEQNKSFLEQVPHREFQDLSIIYKLVVNADTESIQSIKVTNSLAERLGMNEEQLFKYAAENTRRILPPRIRNMNDVMKYSIKVNEVRAKDGSNIKGFATVVFGDSFKITNIAILENKEKGELFVSMPRYRSNERDEKNSVIYKDVCNPITAEFREELYTNILEAYAKIREPEKAETQTQGKTQEMPEFSVTVTPYEREGSNIKGLARIYFENSFIVNNVNILQGKEKIFVSMPSYKTKQVDEHGKPIYQDVCYPVTKDFREKLYNEIIAEYEKAKDKSNEKARENAEQNHGNPDRDKKDTPFR